MSLLQPHLQCIVHLLSTYIKKKTPCIVNLQYKIQSKMIQGGLFYIPIEAPSREKFAQ